MTVVELDRDGPEFSDLVLELCSARHQPPGRAGRLRRRTGLGPGKLAPSRPAVRLARKSSCTSQTGARPAPSPCPCRSWRRSFDTRLRLSAARGRASPQTRLGAPSRARSACGRVHRSPRLHHHAHSRSTDRGHGSRCQRRRDRHRSLFFSFQLRMLHWYHPGTLDCLCAGEQAAPRGPRAQDER